MAQAAHPTGTCRVRCLRRACDPAAISASVMAFPFRSRSSAFASAFFAASLAAAKTRAEIKLLSAPGKEVLAPSEFARLFTPLDVMGLTSLRGRGGLRFPHPASTFASGCLPLSGAGRVCLRDGEVAFRLRKPVGARGCRFTLPSLRKVFGFAQKNGHNSALLPSGASACAPVSPAFQQREKWVRVGDTADRRAVLRAEWNPCHFGRGNPGPECSASSHVMYVTVCDMIVNVRFCE